MSFKSTENAQLRAKIDKAKQQLPLPDLMTALGLADHAKKSARCPWHDDQHPSFSMFKGKDGFWHYKCFVCDSAGGDEITLLVKHFNVPQPEAIRRYLEMAGFPARSSPKSREYPVSLNSCVTESLSNCVSASLCPKGQSLEAELKALALNNACTPGCSVSKKHFKLARDLRAVRRRIGRPLDVAEARLASDEWYQLSQPLLDSEKSPEDYFISLMAQITKVQKPTGEDTISEALAAVAKLSESELPMIPEWADAPENVRRLVALHRELHRRSNESDKRYFLDYRNAAKAGKGLTPQKAHDITAVLPHFAVVELVSKGKPGLNSGKAAEFRYLLGDITTAVEEEKTGVEI